MKRRDFLKGMAGTTGLVLANEMAASTLLFQNQGMINQALNVTTSRVVQTDGDTTDTTYYGADVLKQYGEDISSKANALKVEMAAAAESVAQAEEGTVVLINQNGFLPLAADSTKVTVFGNGSTNSRYNKHRGCHPDGDLQRCHDPDLRRIQREPDPEQQCVQQAEHHRQQQCV